MHAKVGTCFYIAPEVLKEDYNEKCDIWSLGVILYVFVFGHHPFDGEDNKQIFEQILNKDFKKKCIYF